MVGRFRGRTASLYRRVSQLRYFAGQSATKQISSRKELNNVLQVGAIIYSPGPAAPRNSEFAKKRQFVRPSLFDPCFRVFLSDQPLWSTFTLLPRVCAVLHTDPEYASITSGSYSRWKKNLQMLDETLLSCVLYPRALPFSSCCVPRLCIVFRNLYPELWCRCLERYVSDRSDVQGWLLQKGIPWVLNDAVFLIYFRTLQLSHVRKYDNVALVDREGTNFVRFSKVIVYSYFGGMKMIGL